MTAPRPTNPAKQHTVRRPKQGSYGHCLAYPHISINEENLRAMLQHSRKCRLIGLVVVAKLIDPSLTPERFAQIFVDEKMFGMVCGLLVKDGPDPLVEAEAPAALAELRSQAQYAIALTKVKIGRKKAGEAIFVGPLHAQYMKMRPDWTSAQLTSTAFFPWMKKLDALAKELGLKFLCEPLNPTEDGTPDPFTLIAWAIKAHNLTNLGIHLDIGHWHSRKMTEEQFLKIVDLVWYFEWANIGRNPLRLKLGIDMKRWSKLAKKLPKACVMGIEPFHRVIIVTFGLEDLCNTTADGLKNLEDSTALLYEIGAIRLALAA